MIYDKVSSILIMLLSILEVYLVLCLIFELFCVLQDKWIFTFGYKKKQFILHCIL